MSTEDNITPEQLEQLVALVEKLKIAGNQAMQSRAFSESLRLYSDGITAAGRIRDHVPSQLLSQLHSNRAAIHLLQKRFVKAVDDARKAIACDPRNLKGYYRAARASMDLELYQQSCDFCKAGLRIDPDHSDLRLLLDSASKRLSIYKEVKTSEQRGFSEEDAINLQTQLKQLNEQHYLMKQKVLSREFEIGRNDRTRSVLSGLPEGPCYKAIGRGFVIEEKPKIIDDLSQRNSEIQTELEESRKALGILEERKMASEKEMTEMMTYFNKKRQN